MTDTAASAELRSINHLFERQWLQLTDRVHVAVGYGVSTFSFVVGDSGVVAVDSGSMPEDSAAAIAELRTYTDLPILGLVYTHGHPDHTGGSAAPRSGPRCLVRAGPQPVSWPPAASCGRSLTEARLKLIQPRPNQPSQSMECQQ